MLCYICRPKPKPGTLIIEKCIDFGVPPGPLLGKLKSGQDVTLSTGKIVKASDVTTPLDLGPVFISTLFLPYLKCESVFLRCYF